MKESFYIKKKYAIMFFNDILKPSFILFLFGCIIIVAVNSWRFKFIPYMLMFFVCFSIIFFRYMYRSMINDEFAENK